jgi:hypothetical protein
VKVKNRQHQAFNRVMDAFRELKSVTSPRAFVPFQRPLLNDPIARCFRPAFDSSPQA